MSVRTNPAVKVFRDHFGNDRDWSVWTQGTAPLYVNLSVKPTGGGWVTHPVPVMAPPEEFRAMAEEMIRNYCGGGQ